MGGGVFSLLTVHGASDCVLLARMAVYIECVNWVVIAIVRLPKGSVTEAVRGFIVLLYLWHIKLTDTSFPFHLIISVTQTQLKESRPREEN